MPYGAAKCVDTHGKYKQMKMGANNKKIGNVFSINFGAQGRGG